MLPRQPILGLNCYNWLCVNDSDSAIGYGEGVRVVGQQNANIADNLQLRDVAMAIIFWLSTYGCTLTPRSKSD